MCEDVCGWNGSKARAMKGRSVIYPMQYAANRGAGTISYHDCCTMRNREGVLNKAGQEEETMRKVPLAAESIMYTPGPEKQAAAPSKHETATAQGAAQKNCASPGGGAELRSHESHHHRWYPLCKSGAQEGDTERGERRDEGSMRGGMRRQEAEMWQDQCKGM
jgi:hypothetical protein